MSNNDPVHILLVDDLEENLLSLEALLKKDGVVLLKAQSATEALEVLWNHDVALALIDVQMPEINGFGLAELIRGVEKTKNIPIIFLTAGDVNKTWRFKGYEAGAVDFLEKPIEPDILKSKVNVFLELYRQRYKIQQYAETMKDAIRRKDEFLATLAHELRNPLGPVQNGIDILQSKPDEETSNKILTVMERQLRHMVRLIDDLLDISRLNKGKIKLQTSLITIQSAVEAALDLSRSEIEKRRHRLTVEMPDNPIYVRGDLTRLAQAISNLLNNAAKYTEVGGDIYLTIAEEKGQVLISVADNGIGIANEALNNIFDSFMQIDDTAKQTHGGLGIGLALVKQFVELHKGTVEVDSEGRGHGSCFTIRLPLSKADAPAKETTATQSEQQKKSASSQGVSILIVDDNLEAAQTVYWMMESIGLQPTMVNTGQEGLDTARRLKPDVILLDIGLPDMTGYDVARELRGETDFTDTLFIAQTGWGRKKDKDRAFEAGFDHHLTKPFTLDQISEILNKGR